MSDSIPPNSRPVLKLKTAPRKSPLAVKTPPQARAKLNQKPAAAWSDELKHRMQKDMDALLTR
jgi:hypothetical protein